MNKRKSKSIKRFLKKVKTKRPRVFYYDKVEVFIGGVKITGYETITRGTHETI